jgi:hypothetical protein
MPIRYIYLIPFLALAACSQTNHRHILGRTYAQQVLKEALSDSLVHNVVDNKQLLLKDKETAIGIAEPILFSIYGRKNIEKQRPYESHLIDNHWVIKGTLLKGYKGGTFLIIFDARNCQVLRITHGR